MRVLILSSYGSKRSFMKRGPNQMLAWGLDNKGIKWSLHQPWKPLSQVEHFDAVLSWPYALKRNRFIHHCLTFERQCSKLGIPVVNSLQSFRIRHSHYLKRWSNWGIPCARFQRFQHIDEIYLDYPLILRTDGLHRGRNMFLVYRNDEAVKIWEESLKQAEFPPLDLAIEFIDTKGSDGLYRKWRSHVIGTQVIPRQLALSYSWKVNLFAASFSTQAHIEDYHFIREGEGQAGLLIQAAQAVNADIVALDYSKLANDTYIFWEGNRNFQLSVDREMLAQFSGTTGRNTEEVMQSNLKIGNAIAELIWERTSSRYQSL